jgi:hypothetical protein
MRTANTKSSLIVEALGMQLETGRDAAIRFLLNADVPVQTIAFYLPETKMPVKSPDVYQWLTSSIETYIAALSTSWQPSHTQSAAQRRLQAEGALQLWLHAVGKRAIIRDRERIESLIDGMPKAS